MKNKFFKGFSQVLILMTLGGIFGFAASYLLNRTEVMAGDAIMNLQNLIVENSFTIFYIIITVSVIVTLILYNLGKKQILNNIKNEESEVDDSIMAAAIIAPSIGFYLLLGFFGALMKRMVEYDNPDKFQFIYILIAFLGYTMFFVFMQKIIVEKIKELYPEKRGNVYNIDFQKQWEKSLDEREKLALYYTSYKTYRFLEKALLLLLVLSSITATSHSLNTGVYPPLILGFLLVLSNAVYLYFSIKSDNIF